MGELSRGTRPRVIAHRGASGHRPENTLAAYALALEQGADMIEIDLHRTRDGAVVVTHDADLRPLGGPADIAAATLGEVRRVDAGGGEPIPTLDEVLDAFGGRIAFNLELKRGGHAEYPGLEEAVLAAVARRELLPRMLFSSFHDAVLARLRARTPEARVGVLVSPRAPGRALARARELAAEALHPWVGLVTPQLVAGAHAEGLAVQVYTVDEPDEMERLLDLGVDGIFTNFPDRLRALLDAPRGDRWAAAAPDRLGRFRISKG